jgi:hypothetical protein
MGLDMYLNKRSYVQQWDHNEKNHTVTVKFDGKVRKDIKRKRITYVIEEVMYWRKANHIHKWFIDRYEVIDNCEEIHLSIDDLVMLLRDCEKVIANPEQAREILPTSDGFFFGGTDYDEYYFYETKRTAIELRELIDEYYESSSEGFNSSGFYYHASW